MDFQNLFQSVATTALDSATPWITAQLGVATDNSDAALQASRNQIGALNGSGPDNPQMAKQSPKGLLGVILGEKLNDDGSTSYSQGNMFAVGAAVLALIVGAFLMLRRK